MEKKREKIQKKEQKVPESVTVSIDETNKVTVKGEKGQVERKFKYDVKISQEKNILVITSQEKRKRVRALVGTSAAEIANMIRGVKGGITYKMRMVYSHFPVTLKIQGQELIIENFLGEKHPRKAKILEGVRVDIKGQEVEISGIDKNNVGQTAANIELSTKIKNRDKRVFQDGCYIYEKDGKPLR